MQGFGNFLTIVSTESSSFCKNSFGKTIWAPKTASAGERPVSSLGCALSPRSTKGNSADHVATAARARSAAVQSLDCAVRLRVISYSLPVRNVKHFAQLKPKI
jgi:hypothetical protein